MIQKTLLGDGTIRILGTEIDVPFGDEIITFKFPIYGPKSKLNGVTIIDDQNLLRPTTAQLLSLFNVAIKNKDDCYCRDIIQKLSENYYWSSTETLFGEKIIVYDNIDGTMDCNEENLLKLYNQKIPKVRLVEKKELKGKQTLSKIIEDPYVIAQLGGDNLFVEKIIPTLLENFNLNTESFKVLSNMPKSMSLISSEIRHTIIHYSPSSKNLHLTGNIRPENKFGYLMGIIKQ